MRSVIVNPDAARRVSRGKARVTGECGGSFFFSDASLPACLEVLMPRSLRPLLLLALGVLAAAPAHAQMRAYGIKAGATVSDIQTDLPSEDPESRQGISALIFGEWSGAGATGLVVEAGYVERGYSRMGQTVIDDGGSDAVILTRKHDKPFRYVSVAALGRLELLRLPGAAFYALAGPRLNALVGGRSGEEMPGYDYWPVVWDATGGIGFESGSILAEVRYNAGLNDALSGDGWGEAAYHRALDVIVGVRL